MFFELHNEKKIGYKKLSLADLGISSTSHQTHIGLAESVLMFLSDRDTVSEDSIFIYEDKFEYIDAYFDRIQNPDGTFRSPKIRIGERGCISIVSAIRGIAKSFDSSVQWYLLWFGLKNCKIVFFLFNDSSSDYLEFTKLGLKLNVHGTKSIDGNDRIYSALMAYIEEKINSNGIDVLKELEIITQTNNIMPNKKFRAYDIEKANETNKKIGREGEEFVNSYFEKLYKSGQLISYTWYNQERESGFPYDFSIQDNNNNVIYLDVKTTGYDFTQKMIFSSQEIDYIATTRNQYCIYRVYKSNNEKYSIRICDDCKSLSVNINQYTRVYSDELEGLQVGFRGSKLAIDPTIGALNFKNEVLI
ncbi:protein NO VEIN domain-containing protein [Anaerosinus sp.]